MDIARASPIKGETLHIAMVREKDEALKQRATGGELLYEKQFVVSLPSLHHPVSNAVGGVIQRSGADSPWLRSVTGIV